MRNTWILSGMALLFAAIPVRSMAEEITMQPTTTVAPAVAASNAFTGDLYGALRAQEGNLFLSPASISISLAMVEAGARGGTEAEMVKTLHLPPNTPAIHESFGALVRRLKDDASGCELRTANALWAQQGYPFLDSYRRVVQDMYNAQASEADFARAAESVRKIINDWTAGQTNARIRDLIPSGLLNANTRLVLVNAIYFKGLWESPFKPDLSEDAPFQLEPEQTVQVRMMRQKGNFKYGETDTMQLLEMPYVGGRIAMAILLPRAVDGLPALEQQFNSTALQDWLSRARKVETAVSIPKFRMESSFSLNDTLIALGMPLAFSMKADFSGMADDDKALFLSAVVHKAFVEVNEEGTEAAAATGAAVAVKSSVPRPPKIFNADHPFLFIMRDTDTGAILFLGRVMNPAK